MTKQKSKTPSLTKGMTVYFTAFTKDDSATFYLCRGVVTKLPDEKTKSYRVKVEAVADSAPGAPISDKQKSLIGRAISKKKHELAKHTGIMAPKAWLT